MHRQIGRVYYLLYTVTRVVDQKSNKDKKLIYMNVSEYICEK